MVSYCDLNAKLDVFHCLLEMKTGPLGHKRNRNSVEKRRAVRTAISMRAHEQNRPMEKRTLLVVTGLKTALGF